MGVSPYKSSSVRRIFTNEPFRRGMYYQDLTINEQVSRSIVNLDISNNGDFAYPRPAFVNAVMDSFYELIADFPTDVLKQITSLNKTFLIGFQKTVSEQDYLENKVSSEASITKPLGLQIVSVGDGFEEKKRRDGIFEIVDVLNVWDGDTFDVVIDVGEEEEETHVVRLLGIDTPELDEDEPFASEAADYVSSLLDKNGTVVFGDYTVTRWFLEYDPATVTTDRTDSNRTLAHILLEVENNNGSERVLTLTELLLRTGLGIPQVGDKYIYAHRYKEADKEAQTEELGIYSLEEEEDYVENPELPTLSAPEIFPESPDIQYDSENYEFYVTFTVKNTNTTTVNFYGRLNYNSLTGTLEPDEEKTYTFKVSHGVNYYIQMRFYPTEFDEETGFFNYNRSAETYVEIPKVDLDLDEELVTTNIPFEVTETLKFGFGYHVQNNTQYPIHILIRFGSENIHADWFHYEDDYTGNYSNIDWPLFETYTRDISIRYQTHTSLGLQRTFILTKSVEIEGFVPIIEYDSQDLDSETVTIEVENKNNFSANVYLLMDGARVTTARTVGSNSKRRVDISDITEEKEFEVFAEFENTQSPLKTSDVSSPLNIVTQRYKAPDVIDVSTGEFSVYAKAKNTNDETVDIEVYLEDDDGNLVDTKYFESVPANSETEEMTFDGLEQAEPYTIFAKIFSKSDYYSNSVYSMTQTVTTDTVQVQLNFEVDPEDGPTISSSDLPSSITVDQYEYVDELPEGPEADGWVFQYWMYDGSEVTLPYQVNETHALFGKYLEEFEVTLNTDGGTAMDPVYVVDGDSMEEPTEPERGHDKFLHWAPDYDLNETIEFPYTPEDHIELVAIWQKAYKVTFVKTSESTEEVWVLDGEQVDQPSDPEKEGYSFVDWHDSEDNIFDFNTPITEDVTIYAVWNEIHELQIPSVNVLDKYHYQARLQLINNDTEEEVKIHWRIVKKSNSEEVHSGTTNIISPSEYEDTDFLNLEPDTEYQVVDVYASSDKEDVDDSKFMGVLNFTTPPEEESMTVPEVGNVSWATTGTRTRFRIWNRDEEDADITWEITNEADTVTYGLGTLEEMSPDESRTVQAENIPPDTKTVLRNVVAKTRHEDGEIYRPNSYPAEIIDETTDDVSPPNISLNSASSGSEMGAGARHFNIRFTNTFSEDVRIYYRKQGESWSGTSPISKGESTVGYYEVDSPQTNYTFEAYAEYKRDIYGETETYNSSTVTAEFKTTKPVDLIAYMITSSELHLRAVNMDRVGRTLYMSDPNVPTQTNIILGSVAAYGTESDTKTFSDLISSTTYTFGARSTLDDNNYIFEFTTGSSGGGCVTPNTPIVMEDGTTKRASDIVVGDRIQAVVSDDLISEDVDGWEDWKLNDLNKLSKTTTKVETVQHSTYKGVYVINHDLEITRQHSMLIKPLGKNYWTWKDTSEIFVGDYMLGVDGELRRINHKYYREGNVPIVHFEVEYPDNYHAGRSPVVVHNGVGIK